MTSRTSGSRSPASVTLRTVAEAAGCSIATVSKALNGLPVSPANYARVRAAADALGYVPNHAARSMRGAPTMTVGIVRHVPLHPGHELFAVWDRMIRVMEDHGYSVLISVARYGSSDLDRLIRPFFERRVDGLFYWDARPAPAVTLCREAAIPVLAIAYRDERCADLPLITVDPAPAYRQLFRSIRSLGHSRAAEIMTSDSPAVFASREALSSAEGVRLTKADVGVDRRSVAAFVRSLGESADAATVVLAPYPTALQVISACDDLGIGVPDQLSIVATTDSEGAAFLRTPLSTVRTDFDRLGDVAAHAMLDAMAGRPVEDTVLPGCVEWTPRDSLGPAAPGPSDVRRLAGGRS